MKKLVLSLVAALVLSTSAVASAENPFVDVPAGHWAYDYLTQVSQSGIIEGFADKTFKGGNNITRYEAAVMVGRLLAKVDAKFEEVKASTKPGAPTVIEKAVVDTATAEKLEKLAAEFKPELANLGVKVDGLAAKLAVLEGKVAANEAKIAAVDAKVDALASKIGNVKFTGEMVGKVKQNFNGDNVKAKAFEEFYTELKLNLDANVADGVDVKTTLAKFKNNFGGNDESAFKYGYNGGKDDSGFARMVIKTPKTETTFGNLSDVTFSKLSVYKFSGADEIVTAKGADIDDVNFQEGAAFKANLGKVDVSVMANKFKYNATQNIANENLVDVVDPVTKIVTGKALVYADAQNYAANVAFKVSDKVAINGYAGMTSLNTTYPNDTDKDSNVYYGAAAKANFGRLSVDGEVIGYNANDRKAVSDSNIAYEAGAQFDIFKGFKIAGRVLNVENWDNYDKALSGLNNRSYNRSAIEMRKVNDDNVVFVAFGTGGTITSFDPSEFDAVKFNLTKDAALELRGNLIMAKKADDAGDLADNPELITKASLTMPVFKNTNLEASYKLNADKKLKNVNDDSFKLTKSDVEVNLIHTLAKNTTLKVGGEVLNVGIDNTTKTTNGWAEVKVTF